MSDEDVVWRQEEEEEEGRSLPKRKGRADLTMASMVWPSVVEKLWYSHLPGSLVLLKFGSSFFASFSRKRMGGVPDLKLQAPVGA